MCFLIFLEFEGEQRESHWDMEMINRRNIDS